MGGGLQEYPQISQGTFQIQSLSGEQISMYDTNLGNKLNMGYASTVGAERWNMFVSSLGDEFNPSPP